MKKKNGKAIDHLLTGKWLVVYDPASFTVPKILEFLANNPLEYQAQADEKEFYEVIVPGGNPVQPADFKQQPVNIQDILLCVPYLLSDKRWQTINLTSSSIFLGSALTNQGFNVTVDKLQLPSSPIQETKNHEATTPGLIGFTLFEDLLPAFKDYLEQEPGFAQGTGLPRPVLAAGGPLVTLNPLEAAYFLPRINLFVRGEAEQVLPGILETIHQGDWTQLFRFQGVLFQVPGMMVISELGQINRPVNFTGFDFNLGFLSREHLENGLEINFSRGCRRSCLFCSKVQGREFRKLPLDKIENLLMQFSAALEKNGYTGEKAKLARSININDDDIFQDPDYAREVLTFIEKHQFKCWGIQASVSSFFTARNSPDIRRELLDILANPGLFMEQRCLTWLGTDTFLESRGKRLGKAIPPVRALEDLVAAFEEKNIYNYHYWISSDHDSTWSEFVEELELIHCLCNRYQHFSIIAHAPFVVPYHATPLYEHLTTTPLAYRERLKYRLVLRSPAPGEMFRLPLAQRVETAFHGLNRLLNNESLGGKKGFFDYLKKGNYLDAFIVVYNFLKEERIHYDNQAGQQQEIVTNLLETEKKTAGMIASLM